MEVLKDNKAMFGVDFDENKEVLNKISTITSKILKNELAGYITKFIKNELRNEKEKTESAENEEQISEDTEPTKDESKSEVIVEEPTTVKLTDGLQTFDDFMAPDPSCLAPLGESPLKKGMERFFEPDFLEVVQRGASAYSGFPFVIEMGIAYGGKISSRGMKVYRFANRIPLLYDEGSDVVLKVVNDTDWSRYKIKGDPPLVIVSHICSTRVPYKTVGKENVADRPEIERELKLALLSLSRKLSSFMSKRGQAEAAIKRKNLYSKYIPLIAQFCTELAGKKKEPNYKKMITEEPIVEEKTD